MHWHPPNPANPANPARNLAVDGLGRISENGRIPDFPEPKCGTTLIKINVKKTAV